MWDSRDLSLEELKPEAFPRAWDALRAGVADGIAPGMVAGFWRTSEPDRALVAAIGRRRVIPSEQPMEIGTIFDLASVTKVMATATLAAALVDRGWVRWSTPLRAVFPEATEGVTLAHLLSHTAGYPGWEPLWERLREKFAPERIERFAVSRRQAAMRELVFAVKPEARPGERAVYSDISFLLLGFMLEELTGMPLDRAVERFLWDPMGVRSAYFSHVDRAVEDGRNEACAATEDCPWRGGVLQGQVHDDNCWAMGGYAGHAGAFGDARAVLHFARSLLSGFLTPASLRTAWTRTASPAGCERTPGWDTPSGPTPAAGSRFSASTVGHLGFTGTSLWIDREAGLAVTLLTNRVHPTRENIKIREFRGRFHDALRLDLC